MTDLEYRMSILLRSMNIEFEQEFKFHKKRKWRIDFAIPKIKLAIECEGGVFSRGRHNRPMGFIKDIEKYNALTVDNWSLLRFTINDFKDQLSINAMRSTITETINKKSKIVK